MEIPRSRATKPKGLEATAAIAKLAVFLAVLAVAALFISAKFIVTLAAVLLLAIAAFLILVILSNWLRLARTRREYASGFGAILDEEGVTFYGDGGPRRHPWSDFGETFISSLDGRPIIQHLAVSDLALENYTRFSSYFLTPIDYLAMEPAEVLEILKSHPCFPRPHGVAASTPGNSSG